MLKNLGCLLIGIILFTLGFYFSIFIQYYIPLNFSNIINLTVNPSIIFSTFITVAFAYYVTKVVSQQNEKEKQEKYLLIEYFKDFHGQCITKINKILDQDSLNTSLNNSEFKFLRAKLHSSIKLAEQQNFVDETISSKLHNTLTDIWKLLTDESNYDKNGIKQEYKSSARHKVIEIDELIFKIIVEINKAK